MDLFTTGLLLIIGILVLYIWIIFPCTIVLDRLLPVLFLNFRTGELFDQIKRDLDFEGSENLIFKNWKGFKVRVKYNSWATSPYKLRSSLKFKVSFQEKTNKDIQSKITEKRIRTIIRELINLTQSNKEIHKNFVIDECNETARKHLQDPKFLSIINELFSYVREKYLLKYIPRDKYGFNLKIEDNLVELTLYSGIGFRNFFHSKTVSRILDHLTKICKKVSDI